MSKGHLSGQFEVVSSQCSRTLHRFITKDETWIHGYTGESKEKSRQWTEKGQPAPRIVKVILSFKKVRETVFWDMPRIIFIAYLKKCKTINGEYHTALLQCFSEGVKEKCPHLTKKKMLFHHDNAAAHTSVTAMSKIHD